MHLSFKVLSHVPSDILNHVFYLFIYRWMEVIGSAAHNAGRMRLFSRKDSENNYSDIIVK